MKTEIEWNRFPRTKPTRQMLCLVSFLPCGFGEPITNVAVWNGVEFFFLLTRNPVDYVYAWSELPEPCEE